MADVPLDYGETLHIARHGPRVVFSVSGPENERDYPDMPVPIKPLLSVSVSQAHALVVGVQEASAAQS